MYVELGYKKTIMLLYKLLNHKKSNNSDCCMIGPVARHQFLVAQQPQLSQYLEELAASTQSKNPTNTAQQREVE